MDILKCSFLFCVLKDPPAICPRILGHEAIGWVYQCMHITLFSIILFTANIKGIPLFVIATLFVWSFCINIKLVRFNFLVCWTFIAVFTTYKKWCLLLILVPFCLVACTWGIVCYIIHVLKFWRAIFVVSLSRVVNFLYSILETR